MKGFHDNSQEESVSVCLAFLYFVLFYLIGCQREPSSLDVHLLLFLRIVCI